MKKSSYPAYIPLSRLRIGNESSSSSDFQEWISPIYLGLYDSDGYCITSSTMSFVNPIDLRFMKDTVISCNLESSSTTDYFITNFFNKVKYLAKYGNSNFNNRDEWIEIND